jgi:hypothetical protein
MKTRLLLLICLLVPLLSEGQVNLVRNPSFEDTVHCPSDSGVFNVKYWYNPTICGSPDYFYPTMNGNCSTLSQIGNLWGGAGYQNNWGYQLPHSGIAYVGSVTPEAEELIANHLLDTMQAGKRYAVSFYASLGENSRSGIDQINFCFMRDSVVDYSQITCWYFLDSLQAHAGNQAYNYLIDTVRWRLVTDTFTAQGGEEYFVFGGLDTINDHYYLVDSLFPSRFAYYYFDDFDVHCIDCDTQTLPPLPVRPFLLYPNPSTGMFYLECSVPAFSVVEVFDVLGQKIMLQTLEEGEHKIPINLTDQAAGVYMWRVRSGTEILHTGRLVLTND